LKISIPVSTASQAVQSIEIYSQQEAIDDSRKLRAAADKRRSLGVIMLVRILVAISLLIPAVVCAGPVPPQGVWSGSIGTKTIIACFNEGSRWTSYASYYYVDHLKPIVLTTRDTDSFWHEENDTGLWELSAPANGIVVGTWRHPKTQKTLPIKLGFVDGGDDKTPCVRLVVASFFQGG
jgi:hypothetical protein